MRPVITAEPSAVVLTVGLTTKPPEFILNTTRADGLTVRLLSTPAYFAEVVITLDRRQHQFYLLHQSSLEQMVDDTLRLLRSPSTLTETPLLTTSKQATVKKCITLMSKERETGLPSPDPLLDTEVIRSLTLQIASGFGCPPGYMTLRHRVYHKDDPYYDGTSETTVSREQLLKLFTAIEDHLFTL